MKTTHRIKHGRSILVLVLSFACLSFFAIAFDDPPPSADFRLRQTDPITTEELFDIETKYESLRQTMLDMTNEETIRSSLDELFQQSHQEIAILLDSEVLRYEGLDQGDAESAFAIRSIVQWLLDHEDDDQDGMIGWGLKEPRSTFDKSIENPTFHEYAIESAQVLDALMNAAQTNALDQETREEIRDLAIELTMLWNHEYWSPNSDGSGYYWYSVTRTDAVECVNVSSMMAGVFARVLSEYGSAFSMNEYVFVLNRINATVGGVIAQARHTGDFLSWKYSSRASWLNDVVHVGFIVEGLESYRRYVNLIPVPWSAETLMTMLTDCYDPDTGTLYDYLPQLNLDYQREARLYSCGELLHLLGDSDASLSRDIVAFIDAKYRCWDDASVDSASLAQHGYSTTELAFTLRGIASFLYGDAAMPSSTRAQLEVPTRLPREPYR